MQENTWQISISDDLKDISLVSPIVPIGVFVDHLIIVHMVFYSRRIVNCILQELTNERHV